VEPETPVVAAEPEPPVAPAPVEPETPVVAAEPEPPVAPATSDENAESDKPAL
jgi:hypothetical protein